MNGALGMDMIMAILLSSPLDRSAAAPQYAALSPAAAVGVNDVIVAPATPPGPGARAILRLTGNKAWPLLRAMLINPSEWPAQIKPGRFDAQLRLADFFSPLPIILQLGTAPRTYTGQDLIEIHLVGSPPLVQALLDDLLQRGARLAQPGEFTLRAFLAGKLDLTQAEAILTLTTSQDAGELRIALAQLAGGLARPLEALREELLRLLAEVEAGLDFAEEDLSFIESGVLVQHLESAGNHLREMQIQLDARGQARAAYRVVLAGPPNAGKSSLFNALLGRAAALVSPQPGTTRDYLTGTMTVQGVSVELIDTAGRETVSDLISSKVQEARFEQIGQAELLLVCFEACTGLNEAEQALFAERPTRTLLVATKGDLPAISPLPQEAILTSTVTGAGLATLRLAIAERARSALRCGAVGPSLTRCRSHLQRAREALAQAADWAVQGGQMELVAAELRIALDQIGSLVGAVYTEDLLERIFSQFCIGK
jgi:tRNA modification GTPase